MLFFKTKRTQAGCVYTLCRRSEISVFLLNNGRDLGLRDDPYRRGLQEPRYAPTNLLL